MILTPSQQDNGTWNVLNETGQTMKKGFKTKADALIWIVDHGYEANDTGGAAIPQAGEGRF